MPIVLRAPPEEDHDLTDLAGLPAVDAETGTGYPLGSVLGTDGIEMEDPIIKHYDRIRTIAAQCNPGEGVNSSALREDLAAAIARTVDFPPGYDLEWGGLYEMNRTYNRSLNAATPESMILMLLAIILLFNGVRNPLIILLSLPLCIVGVAIALLISGQDMGYVPLLGIYALIGIFIRNAVILLQELDLGKDKTGEERFQSVVDAAVSRVRPVLITACCTAFGMIPLIWDPLFSSMATTMMGGLLVGTMITLIFVPVLYSVLFRIKPPAKTANRGKGATA
jgi:multidrug efflux pump subunit AcrB